MNLLSDLIPEILRAVILAVLMLWLIVRGRNSRFSRNPGARYIMVGFGLIFLGTLFDVTDEFAGSALFGNRIAELIIEKIFGYLLGFVLVLVGFMKLIPAVEAFEQTENELRESERRFRAIFETIPDVVAITRLRDGMVVDLNQAYDVLTGFRRDQLIGQSSLELGSWVNPADRQRMIEGVREQGFVRDLEAPMLASDGKVHDTLVSARMLNLRDDVHLLTIFKDITGRKLIEKALRDSEERFRLIFETNPDPVILARLEDSAIIDVNQAFELSTGISRLEALGHNSLQLGLWADTRQRESFLRQIGSEGEIYNQEADFRCKGGEIKIGLVSARIIELNNDRCMLIVIRDITREKKAERAMIQMDQMKNEFISMAAHELRTPLSTILGFTEFLREPEFFGGFSAEQQQDFLEEIYNKGEALTRIIDDLLDITRIESGHPVGLDLQETDLAGLLAKTVEMYRMHSPDHPYRLELAVAPGRSNLRIDRHRITQVLENLLSNAVKYSPRGSLITLKGECGADAWQISVADHGIGMTPEQVERVFDKFYRADASDTAVSGLGLGMSIARQIVEAHGGEIRVESARGIGTTVTFTLRHC